MTAEETKQTGQILTVGSDPLTEKALAILDGKIAPPNEMIEYVCERAKVAREKHREFVDQIALAEKQLAELRNRAVQNRGAMTSYADDVKTLLAKQEAAQENKTVITSREDDGPGKRK